MRPQGRFHYGWVVLAAASVATGTALTMMYAFTIFLDPIVEGMGWSRGQVSVIYALMFAAYAPSSLAAGWLSDKVGTRRTVFLGSLLFLVSLVLAGLSRQLWQLYLTYGVLLGIALSAFIAPLHTTVSLWFRRKLGLAVGIVVGAAGLGAFFLSPLIRFSISVMDWDRTLILLGVVLGLILLVSSLFLRNQPSDMGLLPYGQVFTGTLLGEGLRRGVFYTGEERHFLKHARSTQPFSLLILIHFLGCVSHSIPLAHVVAMAGDVDILPMVAAVAVSLYTGVSVVGRVLMGLLADRIGGKTALALALTVQATSILLLLVAREPWQLYVFSFFFGIGFGGEMVSFPILNRQYYGSAPIGTVYGYQILGAGMGMAAGGYIGGMMFDLMGSYFGAILVAAGLGYLGLAITLRLAPPLPKPLKEEKAPDRSPA